MNKFSIDCAIVILAGGQSKRMGTAKCNLNIAGKTVLQHMLHTLRHLADTFVVVCASQENQPIGIKDVIWAYDSVGEQGPLRGLEAGFKALPSHIRQVLVLSCDAPLVRPDLLVRLMGDFVGTQSLVPEIEGFPQPLVAIYATDILPIISEMLESGERSLRALLDQIDTKWISEDVVRQVDPMLLSFESMNTLEDYHRVLDIFASLR